MAAAHAFQPEVRADPKYLPLTASAGMLLFQPKYIPHFIFIHILPHLNPTQHLTDGLLDQKIRPPIQRCGSLVN